jgi:hypothetical protein
MHDICECGIHYAPRGQDIGQNISNTLLGGQYVLKGVADGLERPINLPMACRDLIIPGLACNMGMG